MNYLLPKRKSRTCLQNKLSVDEIENALENANILESYHKNFEYNQKNCVIIKECDISYQTVLSSQVIINDIVLLNIIFTVFFSFCPISYIRETI